MSEKNLNRQMGVDSSVTHSEFQTFDAYNRLADRRIVSAEVRKYGLSPKTLKSAEINSIAIETSISLDNKDAARVRSEIERRMIDENVSANVLKRFAWRFQHDTQFRAEMLRYAEFGLAMVSIAFLVGCTMAAGENNQPTQPAETNPTFTPNHTGTHAPTMEAATIAPPTLTRTPTPTLTPDGRISTMSAQATQDGLARLEAQQTQVAVATQSHLATREAMLNHTPESTPTAEVIASSTPNYTLEVPLLPNDTAVDLSLPESMLVANQGGIDYAFFENRRAYLSQLVDARNPNTIGDDEDRAFDAQWLGRNSEPGLTTDKQPNFFNYTQGGFGRGWDSANVLSHYLESNTSFRDLDHGQHFWNNPDTRLHGAAFESRFESIRQDVATIAVHYYLDTQGNPSVWDNDVSLKTFLDQHNAEIQALEDQLFLTMGIEPLVEGHAMRSETRPTAWQTYTKSPEYTNWLLEDSTVCVTYMGDAATRSDQMELVVRAEAHTGLESQTEANDTTLSRLDPREQTEVFVTFSDDGSIVVDVSRVAIIPDPLNPAHHAPNDNQNGADGRGYFGRLIACGVAQSPVLSETSTPGNTAVPPTPGTPGSTPGETTSTPTTTHTPESSVTSVPTNRPVETPTGEPESSPTRRPTSTPTPPVETSATPVTRTPQRTPTESFPTQTATHLPSATPTTERTPTRQPSPTVTPSFTVENTPTRQPTATLTPSRTSSPVPTFTETARPSETPRPTNTLIPPSNTPTREYTPTAVSTNLPEPTPSEEPVVEPTLMSTSTPTNVPTQQATEVPRTPEPSPTALFN